MSFDAADAARSFVGSCVVCKFCVIKFATSHHHVALSRGHCVPAPTSAESLAQRSQSATFAQGVRTWHFGCSAKPTPVRTTIGGPRGFVATCSPTPKRFGHSNGIAKYRSVSVSLQFSSPSCVCDVSSVFEEQMKALEINEEARLKLLLLVSFVATHRDVSAQTKELTRYSLVAVFLTLNDADLAIKRATTTTARDFSPSRRRRIFWCR